MEHTRSPVAEAAFVPPYICYKDTTAETHEESSCSSGSLKESQRLMRDLDAAHADERTTPHADECSVVSSTDSSPLCSDEEMEWWGGASSSFGPSAAAFPDLGNEVPVSAPSLALPAQCPAASPACSAVIDNDSDTSASTFEDEQTPSLSSGSTGANTASSLSPPSLSSPFSSSPSSSFASFSLPESGGSPRPSLIPSSTPSSSSSSSSSRHYPPLFPPTSTVPYHDRLRTFVRMRPLQNAELKARQLIQIESANRLKVKDSSGQNHDWYFDVDRVFGPDASQEDIWTHVANCVEKVLDGYNCTIFAHGQTGTGKTYTMLGPDVIEGCRGCELLSGEQTLDYVVHKQAKAQRVQTMKRRMQSHPKHTENLMKSARRGIIPRACELIFEQIHERFGVENNIKVFASYIQIYNEKLEDLLAPPDSKTSSLAIVTDPQNPNSVVVQGLQLFEVQTSEQLIHLLLEGTISRAFRATRQNDMSSRSHAIFQVEVRQELDEEKKVMKLSRLNLVDLAGNERCAGSRAAEKTHMAEMGAINRSLSTLTLCIQQLARGKNMVSYRSSNLTRLLQESLGGSCWTIFICTITPSALFVRETLATLRLAVRAKAVKVIAKLNEPTGVGAVFSSLQKEVHYLTSLLKHRGAGKNSKKHAIASGPRAADAQSRNPQGDHGGASEQKLQGRGRPSREEVSAAGNRGGASKHGIKKDRRGSYDAGKGGMGNRRTRSGRKGPDEDDDDEKTLTSQQKEMTARGGSSADATDSSDDGLPSFLQRPDTWWPLALPVDRLPDAPSRRRDVFPSYNRAIEASARCRAPFLSHNRKAPALFRGLADNQSRKKRSIKVALRALRRGLQRSISCPERDDQASSAKSTHRLFFEDEFQDVRHASAAVTGSQKNQGEKNAAPCQKKPCPRSDEALFFTKFTQADSRSEAFGGRRQGANAADAPLICKDVCPGEDTAACGAPEDPPATGAALPPTWPSLVVATSTTRRRVVVEDGRLLRRKAKQQETKQAAAYSPVTLDTPTACPEVLKEVPGGFFSFGEKGTGKKEPKDGTSEPSLHISCAPTRPNTPSFLHRDHTADEAEPITRVCSNGYSACSGENAEDAEEEPDRTVREEEEETFCPVRVTEDTGFGPCVSAVERRRVAVGTGKPSCLLPPRMELVSGDPLEKIVQKRLGAAVELQALIAEQTTQFDGLPHSPRRCHDVQETQYGPAKTSGSPLGLPSSNAQEDQMSEADQPRNREPVQHAPHCLRENRAVFHPETAEPNFCCEMKSKIAEGKRKGQPVVSSSLGDWTHDLHEGGSWHQAAEASAGCQAPHSRGPGMEPATERSQTLCHCGSLETSRRLPMGHDAPYRRAGSSSKEPSGRPESGLGNPLLHWYLEDAQSYNCDPDAGNKHHILSPLDHSAAQASSGFWQDSPVASSLVSRQSRETSPRQHVGGGGCCSRHTVPFFERASGVPSPSPARQGEARRGSGRRLGGTELLSRQRTVPSCVGFATVEPPVTMRGSYYAHPGFLCSEGSAGEEVSRPQLFPGKEAGCPNCRAGAEQRTVRQRECGHETSCVCPASTAERGSPSWQRSLKETEATHAWVSRHAQHDVDNEKNGRGRPRGTSEEEAHSSCRNMAETGKCSFVGGRHASLDVPSPSASTQRKLPSGGTHEGCEVLPDNGPIRRHALHHAYDEPSHVLESGQDVRLLAEEPKACEDFPTRNPSASSMIPKDDCPQGMNGQMCQPPPRQPFQSFQLYFDPQRVAAQLVSTRPSSAFSSSPPFFDIRNLRVRADAFPSEPPFGASQLPSARSATPGSATMQLSSLEAARIGEARPQALFPLFDEAGWPPSEQQGRSPSSLAPTVPLPGTCQPLHKLTQWTGDEDAPQVCSLSSGPARTAKRYFSQTDVTCGHFGSPTWQEGRPICVPGLSETRGRGETSMNVQSRQETIRDPHGLMASSTFNPIGRGECLAGTAAPPPSPQSVGPQAAATVEVQPVLHTQWRPESNAISTKGSDGRGISVTSGPGLQLPPVHPHRPLTATTAPVSQGWHEPPTTRVDGKGVGQVQRPHVYSQDDGFRNQHGVVVQSQLGQADSCGQTSQWPLSLLAGKDTASGHDPSRTAVCTAYACHPCVSPAGSLSRPLPVPPAVFLPHHPGHQTHHVQQRIGLAPVQPAQNAGTSLRTIHGTHAAAGAVGGGQTVRADLLGPFSRRSAFQQHRDSAGLGKGVSQRGATLRSSSENFPRLVCSSVVTRAPSPQRLQCTAGSSVESAKQVDNGRLQQVALTRSSVHPVPSALQSPVFWKRNAAPVENRRQQGPADSVGVCRPHVGAAPVMVSSSHLAARAESEACRQFVQTPVSTIPLMSCPPGLFAVRHAVHHGGPPNYHALH